MSERSFILIGPGNLGLTTASLLHERGFTCQEVISRTGDYTERIAGWLGEDMPVAIWEEWEPQPTEFVLVATPDDTLERLGVQLAAKYHELAGRKISFFHFSGIQSSEEFSPLKEHGFLVSSIHPLQTVPSVRIGRTALLGSNWAIEGDAEPLGEELIATLDGTVIELDAEHKVAYHLAAVFASNLLVALEGMAADIASSAGISQERFLEIFAPLIRHSMNNILEHGPDSAITGPLKRADTSTVQKHLNWMKEADQKYLTVYTELSHYLMEILLAENTISLQEMDELTKLLDELS